MSTNWIDETSATDTAADRRAREVEALMTDEERFALIQSVMGTNPVMPQRDPRIPADVPMSAGYTPGVPRLGVPAILSSDASLGVTNPGYRPGDSATALPSAILMGATFNPELMHEGGAMLGKEARSRGFNVQLAGGMNLIRDYRNGRNFEYYSEDPWLSATLAAEAVLGIQEQGVISTVKHYSLNCNETNRHWLDAIIDPDAHRESDLLAFQIAIERSEPGAIMTGYNKINGDYAGGNALLINEILKGAWGYRGYVMSDWGGTLNWDYALAGLDQESGVQVNKMLWGKEAFGEELHRACDEGALSKERLSDMVRRILRSVFAVGADQWTDTPVVDRAAHAEIALEVARQGIVLLRNDGILPLDPATTQRIAVIGGHAQLGVAVGTGSSAVTPEGGFAAIIPIGGSGGMGASRNLYLHPSSPLKELRKALPNAHIDFDPGMFPAEAAALASRSDVVIVFAVRQEGESYDLPDIGLPWGQEAVIEAVTAANPNTVVVLETGNPVIMPWRDKVRAILQAWYPGQAGGRAIAEIVTGETNPSGRLPITFPESLDQTPRPILSGLGTPWGTPTTIRYDEGAEVGYRWFAKTGAKPLYAFGHGLSYTRFEYSDFAVRGDEAVTVSFSVTNTGDRTGADVPQVHLTETAGEQRTRLVAFKRVTLAPHESTRVELTVDPRLLARFDGGLKQWHIAGGSHRFVLGRSAHEPMAVVNIMLTDRAFA